MRVKLRFYIALIALCGLSLMIINKDKPQTPERVEYSDYSAQDMVLPIPRDYKRPTPTPSPTPPQALTEYKTVIKAALDDIQILTVDIELESLGYYFITAYCPSECGYTGYNYPTGWQTASGEICHRSSDIKRYSDPTTCAVDPRLHNIGSEGDLFFIPEFDRVFIAEDTGAFSGYWIDLFYEDYADVLSFPTGYYEVYSVEYVYRLEPASKYNMLDYLHKEGYYWRDYTKLEKPYCIFTS